MGKGRRLTISRSDRFLGTHVSGNRYADDAGSELVEEDVWSVTEHDAGGEYLVGAWAARAVDGRSGCYKASGRHVSGGCVSEAHARDAGGGGGGGGGGRKMAASAPVRVPDWGKIIRVDSSGGADVVDLELCGEMVPPHEWVARVRGDGGASVFVGVGRTLKGRDMRRVRDAVWSQTGFDG